MCAPKAPKPPSAQSTSAAATGTNVATAIANAQLNNVNQVGPDGTLTYDNTGSYSWTDPFTKETYTIPRTTVTTKLSPEQQAIADQQNRTKLNLGTLAGDQSEFLNEYMATPFDGSNEATEARLMELGSKRLDPMLARRREALTTQLSNQGLKQGSEAYERALELDSQSANDAYNQLLLSGRGQAFSEAQATRNQPINEIAALQSGSQVSQPSFGNFSQGSIPTTDNAGLINNNYNQRYSAWQADAANDNALVGGLFGLGSNIVRYA
jgi:hypothetical protein